MIDIFHIHIPKTGGTTLEAYLRTCYGQKFLSHCEHKVRSGQFAEIQQYKAVSGHVTYRRLLSSALHYQRTATCLREPLEQLISHIRWVYLIGEDETHPRFINHPPVIQKIAQHLCQLDFSQPQQVATFFEDASLHVHLFDNVMTRYLTGLPVKKNITPEHVESAKENLHKLDFVLFTASLHSDAKRVMESLKQPLPEKNFHENMGGASLSTARITDVAEVLWPCYQHDSALFNYAKDNAS